MSFQSFVFRHLVIAAVCNTKKVPFFCRRGGGGATGRMMHCAPLMANSRNFRLYQEEGVMVKRWTFNSPVAGVQIVRNSAKWRAEQKAN